MIKKIKTLLLTVSLVGGLVAPLALPVAAHAQDELIQPTRCGTDLKTNDVNCPAYDPTSEERVNNIIKLAVNTFSILVGIVSVVMIIVGGLKYITSGGESANVTSAKNTILYAVIGLVVVALAQIIVRFVLSRTASAGS